MTDLIAVKLCLNCGLCCYTFHNLGMVQDDKELAVVKGFGGKFFINQAGNLSFVQPCPAFDGTCSVYPDNPSSCKTYHCRLMRNTLDSTITIEKATKVVERTKKEVAVIDSALEELLGKRSVIVDDYIHLFFQQAEKDNSLKLKYKDLLLHFAAYTYLRTKYFDELSKG